MTLEQFKKEKVDAMKNHDKETVSALNVIITKIMSLTIEKRAVNETVSEADIDTLLKKAEKELIEEREGFEKAGRTERNIASCDFYGAGKGNGCSIRTYPLYRGSS